MIRTRRGRPTISPGGTTLLDLMKLDVLRPRRVVDIKALAQSGEAGQIKVTGQGLYLGALVLMAEAAEHSDIKHNYPVLAQSLSVGGKSAIAQHGDTWRQSLAADALPYLSRHQLG